MTTIALVHGAWHGAWCWETLRPELEKLGHRVVAMDLPCSDSSATFETYADVVCEALAGADSDVVVVAHSLAGQMLPLVPSRRPVQRLVYLCALPPLPGRTFADEMAQESDMLDPAYLAGLGKADAQRRRAWVDETVARTVLFGDCDDDTATAAFQRLRPQALYPYSVPCPLDQLPDVPSTYVVCTDDRIVNPPWSRRIAREWLDADVVELPGSHSPFLSRPSELADALHRVASP